MKHWQDYLIGLLGLWVALIPWIFGFADQTVATAALVALGGALVVLAIGAIVMPRLWEEGTMALLGLAAIVAPWLLGLGTAAGVSVALFLVGLVVIALVWWTVSTEPEYRGTIKTPMP